MANDVSSLMNQFMPSIGSSPSQLSSSFSPKQSYDPYDIRPPQSFSDNSYLFSGGDLFGNGMFGSSPQQGTSLFGSGMFGSGSQSGSSLFGVGMFGSGSQSGSSLFGVGMFGSGSQSGSSLFGSDSGIGGFGQPNAPTSLLGDFNSMFTSILSGIMASLSSIMGFDSGNGNTPTIPGAGPSGNTPTVPGAGPSGNTPTVPSPNGNTPTVPSPGPNGNTPPAPSPSPNVNSNIKPAEGLPDYSGKPITVNETIVVKAGTTFDGKNQYYQAGSGLGDGGQSESQKPVFILEDGATLKNVHLSGADGIHVHGSGTLDHVWNRDVGEDAVTQKEPGDLKVIGGGAFNASDKIFQLNAGGSLHIDGFLADGFGKGVRTNGGKNIDTDITILNSTFRNGKEAIVRTDSSPNATVFLQGVQSQNVKYEVLAPEYTKVTGATNVGYKPYTG